MMGLSKASCFIFPSLTIDDTRPVARYHHFTLQVKQKTTGVVPIEQVSSQNTPNFTIHTEEDVAQPMMYVFIV